MDDNPGIHFTRKQLIFSAPIIIFALAVLIALGQWQWQRGHWKTDLITAASERTIAPEEILPPSEYWQKMDAEALRYKRYQVSGKFLHDQEAHLYTALTSPQGHYGGQGYFVMTPFLMEEGAIIVVNRGFVPLENKKAQTRIEGQIEGRQILVGLMIPAQPRNFISPSDDLKKNIWYTRDPVAMVKSNMQQEREIAPFLLDLEAAHTPANGLPQAGETYLKFKNNHFGYMLTWFGLAIVLIIMYIAIIISSLRHKIS